MSEDYPDISGGTFTISHYEADKRRGERDALALFDQRPAALCSCGEFTDIARIWGEYYRFERDSTNLHRCQR